VGGRTRTARALHRLQWLSTVHSKQQKADNRQHHSRQTQVGVSWGSVGMNASMKRSPLQVEKTYLLLLLDGHDNRRQRPANERLDDVD
jgi:hypothetical protein